MTPQASPSSPPPLKLNQADTMVKQHLNPLVQATRVRNIVGGPYNGLTEISLDRPPHSLYAKLARHDHLGELQAEADALKIYLDSGLLQVPSPIAVVDAVDRNAPAALLLTKVAGVPFDSADLSPRGQDVFEAELAQALIHLHQQTADHFGPALDEPHTETWPEYYSPIAIRTLEAGRSLLNSAGRDVVDHVIDRMDSWLACDVKPTLVHGNLLARNILIDDASPSEPRLIGFLHPLAIDADPAFELAKLHLQNIVGTVFFETYTQAMTLDQGYGLRTRVYWLVDVMNQAIEHGERFIPACERVLDELRSLG